MTVLSVGEVWCPHGLVSVGDVWCQHGVVSVWVRYGVGVCERSHPQ